MAPEKATEMVLNVDLKCSGCYKKVKKVISKVPQIRDQVFDVDKNKVTIMVVCCSPEAIRDKLCYKGGGAIQSIEIVEKTKVAADKPKEPEKAKPAADKPKEQEKPKPAAAEKPKPKDSGKPKEPEKAKPAEKPKEGDKPKPADKPKDSGKTPETVKAKPKDVEKPKQGGPAKEEQKKPDADVAKMVYEPVHGYPQMYPPSPYPMMGYGQYFNQGYGGAPFEHGYGMPVAPPLPPTYGGFGYEHGYNHGTISNDHGGEDDGEGCSIM